MTRRGDADLVALARAGDKGAFGQLVERHQQMVKRIALSMVHRSILPRNCCRKVCAKLVSR